MAQDSIPPKPNWEAVTILGITGVDNIFSDSTETEAALGGGMEMARMFSTQIYPNLRPCSKEIHKTLNAWVQEQDLLVAKDELVENKVSIEVWQRDYKGLFTLNYKCLSDGTYARSWINYYTITGKEIPVETIVEIYKEYKIGDLWNQIQKSIGCSLD